MHSYEIPEEESAVIVQALHDVCRGSEADGWSPFRLPEPLFTVWAVERAQGVIDNGGFGYFYENDWPEQPAYTLFSDAFRRIGAAEAAQCIDTTAALFPAARPELDYQMRRDYLNESRILADGQPDEIDRLGSRFIDLGGETFLLLADYIRRNADSFPGVSEKPAAQA